MAHKVSPQAFRIGYIKTWKSTGYYNVRDYGKKASFDVRVRLFLTKELTGIPVGNIFLNHNTDHISVVIYSPKVALVMGQNDENLARLEAALVKEFDHKFTIEVKEVKKPELSAAVVADMIARQVEKKLPYRRVVKQAIMRTMEKGGLGIKVTLGGRLNGVEISRSETFKEGRIPRQTIRADLDYATERANTIYGVIGIKVWIYKGEVFKTKK